MQRKFKLAADSCKRIIKDVEVAYKEYDTEVARLEKMKATTDDNFRLNQQTTVVAQAHQSIGDYKQMLQKAIDKVEALKKEADQDVTITPEDIKYAEEVIEKAKKALE